MNLNSGRLRSGQVYTEQFHFVLHPQGLKPLTMLPCSALTTPGDVRDAEPASTDVNADCVVLKTGVDVTFGSPKFHLPFSHMPQFWRLNYSREHKTNSSQLHIVVYVSPVVNAAIQQQRQPEIHTSDKQL